MGNFPVKEMLKNSKPIVRDHQLSVRVNESELELLMEYAERNNKSVHEFVRETAINYGEDSVQFKVLAESMESMILLFDKKLTEILNILKNK